MKIKDAQLVNSISDSMKLPVGNTMDESIAQAVSIQQIKENVKDGLSTVAKSGSYLDLLNKPTIPSNKEELTFVLSSGEKVTKVFYVE